MSNLIHKIRPKKTLGQHFLQDQGLAKRIVRTAGEISNCNVIEIGPGSGILTKALLEAGVKKVFAIEFDLRLIETLRKIEYSYPDRLKVIHADAISQDLPKICNPPRKIVANLPYNIATPLLISWLRSVSHFESFTLMFQEQVAQRIVAKPRNKAYGRLSILSQWLCQVKYEFDVPRAYFHPPPKIESAIISLIPRPKPLATVNWESLERVTAAAFGQRRKMLKSSLKSLDIDLQHCGIPLTKRAEELSVLEFCSLAKVLESSSSFE